MRDRTLLERGLLAMDDLLNHCVDLDDGPRPGHGLRLRLAGLVDQQRRPLVEDTARGGIVLLRPCGQPIPCVDAPAMVALHDQVRVAPAWRSLQRSQYPAQNAVGQREIVQVGAIAVLGIVVR